jgi:hypothetical protein
MGQPQISNATLGFEDFIRVPCPAARITAATGRAFAIRVARSGADVAPSQM